MDKYSTLSPPSYCKLMQLEQELRLCLNIFYKLVEMTFKLLWTQ